MDQEISLREIIEVLLKGKWVIISITFIGMLIAAVISLFVLSPVYESNSMVRIAQSNQDGIKLLDMNTFKESVSSDAAINKLIEKLNLDSSVHTITGIRSQIHAEVVKDINVMKIKVKGKNSLEITNIANLLAYELGTRIDSTARSQAIVEDQKKLKDLTAEIESTKSQLEEAKKQLKEIPEKQTTVQSIGENPIMTSIIKEGMKRSTSETLDLQMQNETVNPAYTAIQTQTATLSINLTKLVAEEKSIQNRIQENTDKINELGNLIAQEKLSSKISDRLLGGEQAIFVSPALQPTKPIGPNKLMNVIVGAFLGAIFSSLIVFFRNYMRKPIEVTNK